MKLASLPDTILAIVAQAGGLGLPGAFAYVGAHQLTYRCPEPHGEYRSGRPSRLATESGPPFVEYEVGLQAHVNGKRGHRWTLIIAYEPNDTYTVLLVEGHQNCTADTMVLAQHEDVYCDTLQSVIESAYDEAIRTYNHGFIPL